METRLATDQIVAVILAGGRGTRIQSLLPDLPKPMAPVLGKPWIEWVVRYLLRQGVRETIISTGYMADVIEKHFAAHPVRGARVRCIAETAPLGTGGGVAFAVQASGDQPPAWLVLNGDTLAFAAIDHAVSALNGSAAAGVIFSRPVDDASRYGSLKTDADGRLISFQEKRQGPALISTGVYLFRHELIQQFPPQRPLSLETDVFPALTASGAVIRVLPMNAPFLDIGTPESLPQAGNFIEMNQHRFQVDPL